MEKLDILLSTPVGKTCGDESGTILEIFIKIRSSTTFFCAAYSLYGPGTSIASSVPHEEFLNGAFGVWVYVLYQLGDTWYGDP